MEARRLDVPDEIERAMSLGAALYVSISGGKDSQAMARILSAEYRRREWAGGIKALHMDLGRAEWGETPEQVRRIAAETGLDLLVRRRPQGDLVQEIQDRMEKLQGTGRPFWPSSAARYCTADQKRGQADKQYRKHEIVISAEGIRAEESPARARKEPVSIRKQITTKTLKDLSPADALAAWEPGQGRVALTWYPILDWLLPEVWIACGTSAADVARRRTLYRDGRRDDALAGWQLHPAYVYGNERLSCALCVLASLNDLRNGAEHNPELFETYLQMEQEGGASFKHGWSLADLLDEAPAMAEQLALFEC